MPSIRDQLLGNAPTRKRPWWAVWYCNRWSSRHMRAAQPGITDEQLAEWRAEAVAICRGYGLQAHPRRFLKAAEIDAVIAEHDDLNATPPPDVEPPTVDVDDDGDVLTLTGNRIKTLAELLEAAEVDAQRWRVDTWRANSYEAQRKGGGIIQLWQCKATLRANPEWMWQPVTPQQTHKAPDVSEVRTTLVIPDSQNGYRWDRDRRTLDPLHDRRAWDIVCQVAEQRQPDQIVLLGDMVDFAEGSKRWPVGRDLMDTTQATVHELHWWLARLRAACPQARIRYIEGNHEDRIDRALQQSMPEIQHLRPVGEDEDSISWRRYLALDALGIEYVGPYGADSAIALHDDCEAMHGRVVRSGGGKTAAKIVGSAHISTIVGHIHRLESAYRTLWSPTGKRTIFAIGAGCICRVDGIVPANGGRMDWQQGFVWLDHVAGQTRATPVLIDDGVAMHCGQAWVGQTRAGQIADELKRPELA